jgi:hypothetical protein
MLSQKQRQAIVRVLEYLGHDEKRDYECQGKPKNHIYRSLLVLMEMLDEDEAAREEADDNEE